MQNEESDAPDANIIRVGELTLSLPRFSLFEKSTKHYLEESPPKKKKFQTVKQKEPALSVWCDWRHLRERVCKAARAGAGGVRANLGGEFVAEIFVRGGHGCGGGG